MSEARKEFIAILLLVGLLMSAGLIFGLLINQSMVREKDAIISSLEYQNELLKIKTETPKKDLQECQDTLGKIWEEATVVTDAYNLCKAQLNKRKK